MSGSNRVVCRQQLTCAPVNWVAGVRYVDDGRFISSAGVTSGIDVSLYTVQRFLGRDAALETAQRVGYPHTELPDDRIARNAARRIKYPTGHLTLVGSDWRPALLLRPVALGLVGVIVTLGLRRYASGRRTLQGSRRNRAYAQAFGGIRFAPSHPMLDPDQWDRRLTTGLRCR